MKLAEIFINKLKIETKQVSIDSLFNDEQKVKRTLYNPPYQRNYVWDVEKATYFLESILIGTEIPPLIFFKSGTRLEIIDGRQRYETILRFLNGELKLKKSGLKKLDVLDLDKKTFSELGEVMQNDFLETQLRVIEFSFASHDGLTQADEDSVKQEIFKRYNSGITPLKEFEIDKAIYFEDDLNAFFKDKLKEKEFHDLFTTLFRYEDKRAEISLKKIRQLLVLHKIPIRYYSVAKQRVTDKYYDLLSSQIKAEDMSELFASFNNKLELIDLVRKSLEEEGVSYNRLISETLFWAFSIMEENDVLLPEKQPSMLSGFANHIQKYINAFKMDRSSFANEIVTRYQIMADYIGGTYGISTNPYVTTSKDFILQNRKMNQLDSPKAINYQDLRINKPEPSTKTIGDICRQMSRNRFLVRPAYQREEVINRRKSSEIIESLLLGIKLPPIFVFKNDDGVSEVIDGQQRILSILAYLGREYMNENGDMVKTKKDCFPLQLKDSILTELNGKRFDQLSEEDKDKIESFGLWVIEINHKYNPNFESLDLFIRLNNKPYPIKDDTFEMWNSYIDRDLIDTIKASYSNCANWFFMRKTGNRMENENNYTVLSYFNYLKLYPQENSDKGPLDIYKVGSRIAFRLRSKGDISKILENSDRKDAFVDAVNNFEFSFINNLRRVLTDGEDSTDKTLSQNLDEILGAENNKRTQQSFYVLWYFLNGLNPKSMKFFSKQIRKQVRQLFLIMSSDISTEDFIAKVDFFRSQYIVDGSIPLDYYWGNVGDVISIFPFNKEINEHDMQSAFFVKKDNKLLNRVELTEEVPAVKNEDAYYEVKINRKGFTKGYIMAILQSSYIFNKYDFAHRNISAFNLRSIEIPYMVQEKQYVFDKVLPYTFTENDIERMFFESVLDKMVDELYYKDIFTNQNVSILTQVASIGDISKNADNKREEAIHDMYINITKGDNKLFSELSAATGVTSSYSHEEDTQN